MEPLERCPHCHKDLDERPDLPWTTESDFTLFLRLCDVDDNIRTKSRAIRPETAPGNPHWERAARMVYDCLSQRGTVSLRKTLEDYIYWSLRPRPRGVYWDDPRYNALERKYGEQKGQRPGSDDLDPERNLFSPKLRKGLRAVVAIIYEQERSGGVYDSDRSRYASGVSIRCAHRELQRGFEKIFRKMAHMDYGLDCLPSDTRDLDDKIEPFDKSKPTPLMLCGVYIRLLMYTAHEVRSDNPCPHDLLYRLGSYLYDRRHDVDPADFAIAIYHFDSHRTRASSEKPDAPMFGYTGVLQEMISDIPKKGTEGLLRKLSTDVSLFHLWTSCQGESDSLGLRAECIANDHGLTLWKPNVPCPFRFALHGLPTWLNTLGYRHLPGGRPYIERAVVGDRIETLVKNWRASTRKQGQFEEPEYGSSPEGEALLGGEDFEFLEKRLE